MNKQDADAMVDHIIHILKIHKTDFSDFVNGIHELCPGYWEKWCEITCEALQVARGTMQA